MVSTELLVALTTLLAAPLTGVVTWRLTRRKEKAVEESVIAAAAQSSVETIAAVMNELRAQAEALRIEIQFVREENVLLRNQLEACEGHGKEVDDVE